MPVASAAIGAGTSLIGGIMSARAAREGAAAQQAAGQKAQGVVDTRSDAGLAALGNVWGQNQNNLQPYLTAGSTAAGQVNGAVLNSAMPDANTIMQQDPGYQFRLDQGQQALERAQSAAGGLVSGGAMKAAAQYGQNFASDEFGNAFNRYMQGNQQRFNQLGSIASMGQNATGQFGTLGNNFANNTAYNNMQAANLDQNLITGEGAAEAAGDMGAANAWTGALSGIGKSVGGVVAGMKNPFASKPSTDPLNPGPLPLMNNKLQNTFPGVR